MKRLKILSKLINLWRVRPLFVMAALIVILDTIYVNLLFKWPRAAIYGGNQVKEATIQGRVRDKTFDDDGKLKSITVGNCLCYVNQTTHNDFTPALDSTLMVTGSIKTIEGPMNPGEFDRKTYYGSKRIFYEMTAESAEIVRTPYVCIREWFLIIRRKCAARIMRFFPLEGGTVNTLICAEKSNLSKERKDLYTRVGVGHFLVISGLHISAFGTFIYKGLRRLGCKVRTGCIAAMTFLLLYGLVVGFSISVIRAAVMFFIRLMADVLKRVYDMLNAVAMAALTSLVINPLCIMDSAFIYSYVTVLSIAVYITFIATRGRKPRGKLQRLGQSLKFPAILWLFVMPVNLYLSYSCSLTAILANTILAPLSAPILVLAFAGFALSFTGATFPTGLTDFLMAVMLRGFDRLCKLIAATPLFSFNGKPTVWKIVIYYIILLWLMTEGKNRLGKMLTIGVVMGIILFVTNPGNLTGRVTTLYVGQGECVVIHTGIRSAVVYDCGSTSKTGAGEYILIPYLKAMGVNRVEGIFVSHGDMDHVGEVSYLCGHLEKEGIIPGRLYVQDIPKSAKSKYLLEAEKEAEKNGMQVTALSKGQKVKLGEYSFTCLWPRKGIAPADVNEGSMIILASRKGFDTLLMGDATKETERQISGIVRKAAGSDIELLLVSHHGSDSASDSEFLTAVSPRMAVVSAGINNRYGHPHREVLKRFKEFCPNTSLFRTDKGGAVSAESIGGKVRITTYK